MRSVTALSALILIACTACHPSKTHETQSWPRVSFEARLLIVPQVIVDEFEFDDDNRVLQLQGDERSDWSRTINQLEIDLLIHAVHSHEHSMSLTAPRVVARDGRLVRMAFEGQRGFEFVGSDGYADSDFEAGWRRLELGLACDPLHAQATGCANVRVDVRLVGQLDSDDRIVKPVALDVWPSATKSFSASAGQTWLISLPHSQTSKLLPDSVGQTKRFLFLIRPVVLQSKEQEAELFPALQEEGYVPSD